MKLVVQRVSSAQVRVEGKEVAGISQGQLVLLGVYPEDTRETVQKVAEKLLKLRIFTGAGKDMNRSVVDVDGSILLVSQFTLCARTDKGNRPSFVDAGDPEHAAELYELLAQELSKSVPVETGRFGEYMDVELVNTGPVTIILES